PEGERRHTGARAIEVSQAGHRAAKLVPGIERGVEVALRAADLLVGKHLAGAVEEQNVDGAVTQSPVVIPGGADSECHRARSGTVEVTQTGNGAAEVVGIVEESREVALGIADLLVGKHAAIVIQEQNVY